MFVGARKHWIVLLRHDVFVGAHKTKQVMLRVHRLGTIAAAARDTSGAVEHLVRSREHFSKRLGPDNPITGEVGAMLTWHQLHLSGF